MRKGFALPINSWSWFYQMGLFETRVPQIWIWLLSITIFPWRLYFSLGQAFDTSIPMFVGLKVFKLAMVFIGETTWCSYPCRKSAGSPRSDGANGCASYGWYPQELKSKKAEESQSKAKLVPHEMGENGGLRLKNNCSTVSLHVEPTKHIFFRIEGELFDLLGAGSLYNFGNFTIIPQIQKIYF